MDRYEEIKGILGPFLKLCYFQPSQVQWVPVSGYTGQNLVDKIGGWWSGPTLVEAIDIFEAVCVDCSGVLRVPVQDVYRSHGGVNVIGRIESGSVQVGMDILVMPSRVVATVKGMSD